MTEITLQWTPDYGPRRKLTFEQTETGWVRIETVWDGKQWRETGTEEIANPTVSAPQLTATDPAPPTIESLCEEIYHTWFTPNPNVLLFDTENPVVVAAKETTLRYYSSGSTSWHQIDEQGLQQLIRQYGLPIIVSLAETPYSRAQLERGVTDD